MSKLYEQLVPQAAAVRGSWDRLQKNRTREWGLYGHDIGINSLNLAIGGLIPRRVTTIGARSGTGKTAIITSIADASARVLNGRRAELLILTWELDPSLLIDRTICMKSGLTLKELNQGAKLLNNKTIENVKATYSEAAKLPVVYQLNSTNIGVVRTLCKEFVAKCKEKEAVEGVEVLPVLIIDYLNMAQFEGTGLRTYGIGDFMNGVKQLCNELAMAGILFAQINRSTDKESRIPDRSDFSDSSAIENASDNLIVLYRPEYHGIDTIIDPENKVEISSEKKMLIRVLKGRDYGTGDFLINCDIKYFRFWDINHDHKFKYWEQYSKKSFWMEHFGFAATDENLALAASAEKTTTS